MSDGFDAGALVWKLRTVGKNVFDNDMRGAQEAFAKTGKAAKDTAADIDKQADSSVSLGQQIKQLEKQLAAQGDGSETLRQKIARLKAEQAAQTKATEEQRAAAKELSTVLLTTGAATGALVALSVAKYSDFSAQMSNTAAATKATASEQRELADAALDAGADTAYSATEAAAAQEELAKAGQSVADITGGSLAGSLALAAAGQLDVARSAEIMATVLTQFRLPAQEAGHVADVLAAGAGKAQGSVDDLSLALSYVGPLASSMGWSLEETAGTIAYFSTQGIQGEKAGTALRGVIAALQAPSAQASKIMAEYGINMYDANGRMLEAAPLAQELKDKLSGLTDQERLAALGRIFGNEALSGATLLYEGGAKAISEMTDAVNDNAYSTEQAAQRQDNLAGDVEKLGGAFDTALIKTGSGANVVLRETVQTVTSLVDVFGDAPAPVQGTALALGVATTAALVLGGATLAVRARWAEWSQTLSLTNGQMARSAVLAGGVGVALTGVATVIALVVARQAEMNAGEAEFADTLDKTTGAATANTRAMIAKKLADAGVFEQGQKLKISQKELTDALFEGGDAAQSVIDRLKDSSFKSGGFDIGMQDASRAADDLNTQLNGSKDRFRDLQAATEGSGDATETATAKTKTSTQAYIDAAGGAKSMKDELSQLLDVLNGTNNANADAITSTNAYRDTLGKIDEVIQKARDKVDENEDGVADYTLSLDENTRAGRDNMGMLVQLASDTRQMATDHLTATGNVEEFQSKLQEGRDNLIQRAQDLGYNADEALRLADSILAIPPTRETELIVKAQAAIDKANEFKALWENIRSRTVTLDAVPLIGGGQVQRSGPLTSGYQLAQADGGVVSYYANGATVPSEHHVAQMAKAGSYRVWAEPETGGETYVPHAESKRARSEAIMAETASIFGGMYIPAAALAGGGASATAAAPTGSGDIHVHFDALNIPPGVTYSEAVSIVNEAIREALHQTIPTLGF